jgi:hypothetical protein
MSDMTTFIDDPDPNLPWPDSNSGGINCIADFVNAIRPNGGCLHVCSINPDAEANKKAVHGRVFPVPGAMDELIEFVTANNAAGLNIHYSLNGVADKGCVYRLDKPSKSRITAIHGFHGDVDPSGAGSYDERRKRLLNGQSDAIRHLKPTVLVDSGNGLQGVWVLPEPADIKYLANAEGRNRALIDVLGGDAGTENIDRLLRMPFTVNHATETKRKRGYPAETQSTVLEFNGPCDPSSLPNPKGDAPARVSSEQQPWGGEQWEVDETREILTYIQPDCGDDQNYQNWLEVLMGVHARFGNTETAIDLLDEWSARGDTYEGREVIAAKLASFRSSGITFATVASKAKAVGADLSGIYKTFKPDDVRVEGDVATNATKSLPPSESVDIFAEVPPRRFIYRRQYIKGYLTGTAATGGTGKTSLTDAEMVSMAIGRDLLDDFKPLKCGPLKVLMLSLEDDRHELLRRHKAIVEHYDLSRSEIALYQENLRVIYDSEGVVKVASEDNQAVTENHRVVAYLSSEIEGHCADVVNIDPLISIHGVDENRNTHLQVVVRILRHLARHHDVAMHYVHHNRKGSGQSADDFRGGVALRDGSRALRMMAKMTKDEAQAIGISSENAQTLVGIFSGKANFEVGAAEKTWLNIQAVCLDNGTDLYDPDYVGVVSSFTVPETFDGISVTDCERAWSAIDAASPERRRKAVQAKDGFIGHLISEALGVEMGRAKRVLKDWVGSGVLVEAEWATSGRKTTTVYVVDRRATDAPV